MMKDRIRKVLVVIAVGALLIGFLHMASGCSDVIQDVVPEKVEVQARSEPGDVNKDSPPKDRDKERGTTIDTSN